MISKLINLEVCKYLELLTFKVCKYLKLPSFKDWLSKTNLVYLDKHIGSRVEEQFNEMSIRTPKGSIEVSFRTSERSTWNVQTSSSIFKTLENLSYFSLYSSYFKDIYIYVKLMLEWFSKAKPYIFGINT